MLQLQMHFRKQHNEMYGKLLRNIAEAEYGPHEIEEQAESRVGRSA